MLRDRLQRYGTGCSLMGQPEVLQSLLECYRTGCNVVGQVRTLWDTMQCYGTRCNLMIQADTLWNTFQCCCCFVLVVVFVCGWVGGGDLHRASQGAGNVRYVFEVRFLSRQYSEEQLQVPHLRLPRGGGGGEDGLCGNSKQRASKNCAVRRLDLSS